MRKIITIFQLVLLLHGVNTVKAQTWTTVGTAGFSGVIAYYPSIAIDTGGTPYVAFSDYTHTGKVTVMKYNGGSWTTVGSPQFTAGNSNATTLAIDKKGTPYVAYDDFGYGQKASVMKYDGTSWVYVGTPGFSAGITSSENLVIDTTGTPYVSFCDNSDSGKVTVMKYDGSSWVIVGTPGFSPYNIMGPRLTLDSSGTPYVVFQDYQHGSKASVMKYDGSNWVYVGAPDFTASAAVGPMITIDGSGTPYVAFSDNGNSFKATVMKYDGSNWVLVGAAGFSPAAASSTVILNDRNGTFYVAYEDGAGEKASVMKYNGSSWVNAGNDSFSAGTVYLLAMAIDTAGAPYVVYQDFSVARYATVMKLSPSAPPTISGNMPLCLGSTITLTGSPAGGTWSSDNLAIDTVSIDSGIVRGIAAGTANITYTVGGLSTSVVTTVNGISRPTVGCEAGSGICGFANVELLSGVTVNYIAGVTNGTTEIYPVFPTTPLALAVGTFSYAPTAVDVSYLAGGYTSPTWSVFDVHLLSVSYAGCTWSSPTCSAGLEGIAGNVPICSGGTQTLTVTPAGGTWSSGNPGVATVGSATGVVTGIGAGTAFITYNMGTVAYPLQQIIVVTVNASAASAGTITGAGSLCAGGTTSLTDATTGGAWSSGAPGIATVSSAGLVTGVSIGTATISYTVTGSCGSASATAIVTVSAGSAGTITGSTIICSSGTSQLTDVISGGVWTSGSPGVASVSASGLVTGVTLGTATISYTTTGSCGGTATLVVTVSMSVTAGTITGTATICSGSTTTLSDAVGGGIWSSSNTLIATAASTGVITGVAAGTAIIYYTVSNSCGTVSTNRVVTVNPSVSAGTITGAAVLCIGGSTSLTDAVAGGTWSSVTPAVATVVGSTGIVSGVSEGTSIISYTITNSCGTSSAATRVVTVNAASGAGTISGTTTVCTGGTTALTDAVTGGTWSSGSPAFATAGATGIVTGVTPGTATISYTVTNSCGTAVATTTVTITGASAGTITGPATVLVGSNIALTDSAAGGTWSASNGNATVSATGLVTGVAYGTVIISYTVASGCGTISATKVISVGHVTSLPGISGYFFYLCTGATAAFWDATTGGSWDISPTSVGTVSASGVVTGIGAGTATLSYTYGGSTVTAVVTVYATPAAITGTASICVGTTTNLTDATPGGTWSSSAVTIASISTAGLVTGAMAGTTTIYYTGAAGCKASTILTVTAGPSGIAGATSVCAGSSMSLSDFTAGGTWSSTGSISVAATGSTTALATGISAGSATVTYSLGGSCYRTFGVTVKPLPTSILGNLSVCGLGSVTFLSDVTSGISWTIAPVTVGTVSPSGRVYGVSAGTATVTYTATNACNTTAIVTVNAAPVVAAISGATNVSHGATITLSDATAGGAWSSSNSAIASVDASGFVTGVAASGVATITYAVGYGSACNAIATKTITVHTPAPHVYGGTTTTTVGATVSVADELAGGTWSSGDNTIATVDGNGIVNAIATGNVQITHVTTSDDGTTTITATELIVNAPPFEVRLIPNPNNGTFMIRGTIGANRDEAIIVEITNMLGQVVYSSTGVAMDGVINQQILLGNNLANGMYLLHVKSGSESKLLHFVIEK